MRKHVGPQSMESNCLKRGNFAIVSKRLLYLRFSACKYFEDSEI